MRENCRHFGGILERMVYSCCGGRKKEKIYVACGKCLRVKSTMCCETCRHYERGKDDGQVIFGGGVSGLCDDKGGIES